MCANYHNGDVEVPPPVYTVAYPVAYPGGVLWVLEHPLNDRIHSFVSAMAQDCIYAKVAPPTTLRRKRFGYK